MGWRVENPSELEGQGIGNGSKDPVTRVLAPIVEVVGTWYLAEGQTLL